MIIGIIGKIGSGKSTGAEFLSQEFGYEEYSISKPLKEVAKIFGFSHNQVFGTQEQKLEIHPYWGISGRTFLQKVGTDLFRNNIKNVLPEMKIEDSPWLEIFKLKFIQNPKKYIVSDVRFEDEAEFIKKMGGIIIRINRNEKGKEKGKETVHISELEMDKIKEDFSIDNNYSIEEYRERLKILVTAILTDFNT